MGVLDNLITVGVLLALFILGYVKMTGKTLMDFVREVKEMFESKEEEIYI